MWRPGEAPFVWSHCCCWQHICVNVPFWNSTEGSLGQEPCGCRATVFAQSLQFFWSVMEALNHFCSVHVSWRLHAAPHPEVLHLLPRSQEFSSFWLKNEANTYMLNVSNPRTWVQKCAIMSEQHAKPSKFIQFRNMILLQKNDYNDCCLGMSQGLVFLTRNRVSRRWISNHSLCWGPMAIWPRPSTAVAVPPKGPRAVTRSGEELLLKIDPSGLRVREACPWCIRCIKRCLRLHDATTFQWPTAAVLCLHEVLWTLFCSEDFG